LNSFLVASAVYLFLTLAGVTTPWREAVAMIAFIAELIGNYQDSTYRKFKGLVKIADLERKGA
jgi:hypothetical protein